jgi:glucose/mannose-6-phosphate isomerase
MVIYGAGIFGSVARRWKTQFNENSKAWAFFELLPEAHHNSVVGYALPDEVKGRAFVILLRPGYLHTRTHLRYDVTRELLERESIPHQVLEGRGESALSNMLSAILLGDYVSYYLALLQGVDPSPVPVIDYIKGRLADAG